MQAHAPRDTKIFIELKNELKDSIGEVIFTITPEMFGQVMLNVQRLCFFASSRVASTGSV